MSVLRNSESYDSLTVSGDQTNSDLKLLRPDKKVHKSWMYQVSQTQKQDQFEVRFKCVKCVPVGGSLSLSSSHLARLWLMSTKLSPHPSMTITAVTWYSCWKCSFLTSPGLKFTFNRTRNKYTSLFTVFGCTKWSYHARQATRQMTSMDQSTASWQCHVDRSNSTS